MSIQLLTQALDNHDKRYGRTGTPQPLTPETLKSLAELTGSFR